MSSIREVVKRGIELYPNSKSMRKQWVRWTVKLVEEGRHGLQTGGWSLLGKLGAK